MMYAIKVGNLYVNGIDIFGTKITNIRLSIETMKVYPKELAEKIAKVCNGEIYEIGG